MHEYIWNSKEAELKLVRLAQIQKGIYKAKLGVDRNGAVEPWSYPTQKTQEGNVNSILFLETL